MNGFITPLYRVYCENNKDIFSSNAGTGLKDGREQIVNFLSENSADRFCETQISGFEVSLRRDCAVAIRHAMLGASA